MYSEPSAKAPYLDWTLDRWKISVILALFIGLALASIARPPTSDAVKMPTETQLPLAEAESDAPPVISEREESTGAGSSDEAVMPRANDARLLPGAVRPGDMLRLPLALATFGPNAVVPPGSVNVLAGTAAAGSSVKVYDQVMARVNRADLSPGSAEEKVLGLATASNDGLWQLALAEPFVTGQHIITLHELGPQGELSGVSAPVVVTVLAAGEQGPLALATPIIRTPPLGARMTPGIVEFTGTGLPGMVVRLHLNNSFVAEALVTTQDDWRIVPEAALTPGVYTARVMAMNPQGDVLAESAPVIFVVQEEPTQSSLPLTLPAPTLPLTISGLAYGDRRRTTLFVNGVATPHSAIAAWLEGRPIKAVNAALDGRWLLSLENIVGFDDDVDLEVRSNFGERVHTDAQLQRPVLIELPARPRLLEPRAGEILTTSRPLMIGLAQPMTDVAILINRQVVAQVQADLEGSWNYRVVDPLPNGAVTLAVGCMADTFPEQQATPIVVVVMPNSKFLAARSPLSLTQKPPVKLYYSAPTSP
jgi:hypothetical protein